MDSNVKENVKKYYGTIAEEVLEKGNSSCCGGTSCCGDASNSSTLYSKKDIENLPADAVNASLGCAAPILFADIKEGEMVLDLGSGGGIDVLQASKYVGESGKVYGLDMTDEMLALANKNKKKAGVANVEFIKGYIEDIPLEDDTIDVIISNCVINLSENKKKSLQEAYRVLKNGGRLAIADIVTLKDVPDKIRKSAEMWVGCIAGTIKIEDYEAILREVGFKNIEITPVNIYTKDFIQSISTKLNKNLNNIYSQDELNLLDGAFASAAIKAVK
jgi:ubiquinone/menaquinone biosynthesis C-methylase UbiE